MKKAKMNIDCNICGKPGAKTVLYYASGSDQMVEHEICNRCKNAMTKCNACGTLCDDNDYVGEWDCACCQEEEDEEDL